MMKTCLLAAAAAVLPAAALLVAEAPSTAQATSSDPAAQFGAREGIEDISLSPDGASIAFIVPERGKGNALYVVPTTGGGTPKRILAATGDPEIIDSCGWASNDRLLCNIIILRGEVDGPTVISRLVALDAGGGNMKLVSRREGADAIGRAFFGGEVIDWAGGADGSVLVGRVYVPEERIGTNVAKRAEGFGVDRVDTRTLKSDRVEAPKKDAVEYLSDGAGKVRVMGTSATASSGYARETIRFFSRPASESSWHPLSDFNVLTRQGFVPVAINATENAAYGFQREGGRQALYKIALDGSRTKTRVFAHPEVDVDRVIRIGRSRRVVGASYATEKREAVFFDPELKALATSLGRALPGAPSIRFAGASADEKKLLIWAGSDVDPGRYYLLDRASKKMSPLLASRPELDAVKLASVKAINYKAADGTSIPGYLTLPPGSNGKGLPAIVMPHGGPSARDEWGFDWLAQYWVNRGYAVLQPNFRGSAGYGDAWFQKNGFQSWRTAIGDVSDGGRWLVSQGIARPDRLAIMGWSYGGYAALQSAAVAPELFKAVVAIAPVTDLGQLKADAMKYTSGVLQRDFIGAGAHIREGSPAQNASAIKAPVLLFHGSLDSNVPVAQSKLMNDKLKDAGRKGEIVLYPGLEHSLIDSVARADMLRRSEAFLRSALGG